MESTPKQYAVYDNKDNVYILSKKEHDYLIEHQEDRFIVFTGVGTINPAYVVSIKEEPLDELKQRFCCTSCNGSGIKLTKDDSFGVIKPTISECDPCKGKGYVIPE